MPHDVSGPGIPLLMPGPPFGTAAHVARRAASHAPEVHTMTLGIRRSVHMRRISHSHMHSAAQGNVYAHKGRPGTRQAGHAQQVAGRGARRGQLSARRRARGRPDTRSRSPTGAAWLAQRPSPDARSAAQAATWFREVNPSLAKMFATCRATVAGLMTSSSAMARLES